MWGAYVVNAKEQGIAVPCMMCSPHGSTGVETIADSGCMYTYVLPGHEFDRVAKELNVAPDNIEERATGGILFATVKNISRRPPWVSTAMRVPKSTDARLFLVSQRWNCFKSVFSPAKAVFAWDEPPCVHVRH
jgi:hypothetical protein